MSEKPNDKTVPISLRIPEALYKRVKAASAPIAYTYTPTLTKLVIDGLEWALEQDADRRKAQRRAK